MGSSSSHMQDVPLVAQATPVAAIDLRFCVPTLVELQEKPHYVTTGRTFIDLQSGATWFKVQGQLLSTRVKLLDVNHIPVASYRPKTFTLKSIHYVHAGANHDGEPKFEISARYYRGNRTTVSAVFTDVLSGVRCEIGFVGDWCRRDAGFWLDRGRTGARQLVAKVFCPEGVSRSKYHIVIAPNMDVTLIVMICDMLADQQWQDKRSSNQSVGPAATYAGSQCNSGLRIT